MNVSTNHRLLTAAEIPAVAAQLADSWKDPSIPRRQWDGIVKWELEKYRQGVAMPHFDVLVRALKALPPLLSPPDDLLDVGASSGFYSEVLRIAGFDFVYEALDYSEEYKRLAEELWPGIRFTVGSALWLPFPDDSFETVLHSACIMHLRDYARAIREAARVACYTVFHRTPVVFSGPTVAYEKTAYDVPCIEFHFSEDELFTLFADSGLEVVREETIFRDTQMQYSHKTYLTKKTGHQIQIEPYFSNKNV